MPGINDLLLPKRAAVASPFAATVGRIVVLQSFSNAFMVYCSPCRMNVIFVNPPNQRHDIDGLAPPLGILTLAERLIVSSQSVAIIDFNLESCSVELGNADYFYENACRSILDFAPDVVCFTSMLINSHVALEIGRRLKATRPTIITVCGGPHFGAIAPQLVECFPWIDFVVKGEGEQALPELIRRLERKGSVPSRVIDGFTDAACGGHPWRAYDKIILQKYFDLNTRRLLDFETGRGCKYSCSFCYSQAHWGGAREIEIEKIVEDVTVAHLMGARHLFFVQDNFLNGKVRAKNLCVELSRLTDSPTWNCYGTLPDLDEEISVLLAKAGCTEIYLGVDAVTAKQKKELGKNFVRNEDACLEKLSFLTRSSVVPTCSLIFDPFNWDDTELEQSLRWAAKLRLHGANLSFHVLTAYPETTLAGLQNSAGKGRMSDSVPDRFRVNCMFDCPDIVVDNQFAQQFPQLFPLHCRPKIDFAAFQNGILTIHVAQNLISRYPLEISDIASDGISVLDLFREIGRDIAPYQEQKVDPIYLKLDARADFEEKLLHNFGFFPMGETLQEIC